METRGGLLGVTHRGPVEVADDESNGSTIIPQETSVVADILELYVRFRAKEDMMPREGWLELLEVTMPKLEVCRHEMGSECVALYSLVAAKVFRSCDRSCPR